MINGSVWRDRPVGLVRLVGRALHQRIGEKFSHVAGVNGSEVIDLVTAACAGGNDDGTIGLAANSVRERFGDF